MASHIFHTTNPKRWKNIKWTWRVLLFIFLFFLTILVFALIRGSKPSVPNLEAKSKAYENALDPSHSLFLNTPQSLKYKGFKDFLLQKQKQEGADSMKKKVKTFF